MVSDVCIVDVCIPWTVGIIISGIACFLVYLWFFAPYLYREKAADLSAKQLVAKLDELKPRGVRGADIYFRWSDMVMAASVRLRKRKGGFYVRIYLWEWGGAGASNRLIWDGSFSRLRELSKEHAGGTMLAFLHLLEELPLDS